MRIRRRLAVLLTAAVLAVPAALPVWNALHPVHRWSDPATWGGRIPTAGASVRIAAGETVMLDVQPPPLERLVVDGTLLVPDRDLTLRAGGIFVRGTFRAGTPAQPITHRVSILLDSAGSDGGAFTVNAGGRLLLAGAPVTSWTKLRSTALPGSHTIAVDDTAGWKAGDRIAIAPSGFDVNETEERTIASVDGASVALAVPLRFRHWGTAADGVDERAEVGLLSRSIVVRSASAGGDGGHVIVLHDGALRADSVEFSGLGKRGRKGFYPVHFHLAGDGRASYVVNSSVDRSNNRCIAIHGTSNVTIRNNVAYETSGHCYFLEDGIETGITIEHNLGMAVRVPQPGTAILDSDSRPAVFWITNPQNVVRDNAAAGSEGNGFWYDLSPHPTGPSATNTIWPRRTDLASFSGNVSHSNEQNGLFVDILRNPPGVTEAPNYEPPDIADFTAFTSYKNRRRGAWLRGTKLRLSGSQFADNSIGVTFAGADDVLQSSLLVGETPNFTGPPKPFDPAFPIRGFEFYDGQVGVTGTRFVNFVPDNHRAASALSGLEFSPFFTDPTNFASGLTFVNAAPVYFQTHMGARDKLGADGYRGTVFRDRDGSVTGVPDASVVFDTPLLADGDCTPKPAWNALVCKADYASLFLIAVGASRSGSIRARVAHSLRYAFLTLYGNPERQNDVMFQTNVRADRSYAVTFEGEIPAHVRVGVHHLAQGETLTLVFPQIRDRAGRPATLPIDANSKPADLERGYSSPG